MHGNKPYDKRIRSVESLPVTILAFGEGFHNYHHTYPWDYKTGELGNYKLNLSTAFIDFFAKIGWATNRKSVSPETIKRRVEKCGDGSHAVWGYGDEDIAKEDIQELAQNKSQ